MEITQLIRNDEDRAVSPVIGVILMVAITVILAAVIGTFVLGLGDQVQTTAPNAQFSFDYDSGTSPDPSLQVTHDGGDGIDGSELYILGDVEAHDSSGEWSASGSMVRAGQSITVNQDETSGFSWADSVTISDGHVEDDTEVRVVWQDSDSEQSSTLRTWTRS